MDEAKKYPADSLFCQGDINLVLLTVGASQIWICCSDFQRNCIASLTECPWGLWFSKAHGVQYPLFLTVHSAIAG